MESEGKKYLLDCAGRWLRSGVGECGFWSQTPLGKVLNLSYPRFVTFKPG